MTDTANHAANRLLPPQFQPPWRDVPALAIVATRAFGTRLAHARYFGAAWSLPSLLWLCPVLAYLRATRQLAAIDRHAMCTVTSAEPRTRATIRTGAGVAVVAPSVVLVTIGTASVLDRLAAALGRGAIGNLVPIAVSPPALVKGAALYRPFTGSRAKLLAAGAAFTARGERVVYAGMAAAWPRGERHFTCLRDAMSERLPRFIEKTRQSPQWNRQHRPWECPRAEQVAAPTAVRVGHIARRHAGVGHQAGLAVLPGEHKCSPIAPSPGAARRTQVPMASLSTAGRIRPLRWVPRIKPCGRAAVPRPDRRGRFNTSERAPPRCSWTAKLLHMFRASRTRLAAARLAPKH
jgi:hypothetical protein